MTRVRRQSSLQRQAHHESEGRHWLVRKNGKANHEVLLEEYRAVRAEINTSLNAQISVLAFGAATLGFSFAAAAQTSSHKFRDMFLLVLVPLLCYLVLTVWFAEVMRMLRAGTFLMRLEKRLDEDFGYGALTWENTIFHARCQRGPRAFLQDPDRFRMLAIALLFLTIAATSIAIGWGAVDTYSWQHIFAISALVISAGGLIWLYVLRLRDVQRLARPLLREGSDGDDVTKLQRLLQVEQLYHGAIDGVFGRKTKDALCVFQARNGLEADGVVGLPTMAFIEQGSFSPRSMGNGNERRRRRGRARTQHARRAP